MPLRIIFKKEHFYIIRTIYKNWVGLTEDRIFEKKIYILKTKFN